MPREAFLMYVDNWLSSGEIELMDATEERGYFRLLLRAWKEEDCGLPTDELTLAAWSKMGTQWFRETADRNLRMAGLTSGQKVLRQFFLKDGRYYNPRLLSERDYQNRINAARKENGSKGGRPKKEPGHNQTVNLEETKRFSVEKLSETNLVSVSVLDFSSENTSETENTSCFPAEVKPLPSWMLDEVFVMFAEKARIFWPRVLEEELAMAERWNWRKLSNAQRLEAIEKLQARIDAGEDGEYVKKLPDYLISEWKRKAREPTTKTSSTVDYMTPRERARYEEAMRD